MDKQEEVAAVVETTGATEVTKEVTPTTLEQNNWPGVKQNERDINLSESVSSFADAITSAAKIQTTGTMPAASLVKNLRSSFSPDTNPGRKATFLSYVQGTTLILRRNSGRGSEGVTLRDKAFLQAFDKRMDSLPAKTQLTIILTDGTPLYGYVAESKKRAYLPLNVWPQKITLPTPGLVLNVSVKMLIIG